MVLPRALVAAPVLLVLTAAPRAARADDRPHPALRYDLDLDVGVTSAAAVALIITEIPAKKALAPKTCGWCEPPGIDTGVRDALRWSTPKTADAISNVTVLLSPIASAGVSAIGARSEGASSSEIGVDVLVVGESVALALAADQLVKFTVGRQRPDVHARTPEERTALANADDNLSFYSGHTTLAFSGAVSAGMVATMRGYASAPYVWATGLTLATATGYLRIAADRHYFTDVITGAALGAGIGILVPYVFHRPSTTSAAPLQGAVLAGPGGPMVGVTGVW